MIGAIILMAMGLVLIAGAAYSYRGRGALLATMYWTATPQERARFKTPENYRFVGRVFLGLGLGILGLGLSFWTGLAWLRWLALALVSVTTVYAIADGLRKTIRGD